MPFSLPDPPSHLRELLDQSCNPDEKPFFRLTALTTLVVRLERWLDELVDYCEPRGGTFGMDAAALRAMVLDKEQHADGGTRVADIQDGNPTFREATAEELEAILNQQDPPQH